MVGYPVLVVARGTGQGVPVLVMPGGGGRGVPCPGPGWGPLSPCEQAHKCEDSTFPSHYV